jgi:hypothetical protein
MFILVKKTKKMVYRVVLLMNGEYKKTLYRSKTKESAFIRFHKIKEENKIMFPKKFVNTVVIKPVRYEICVTKITEDGDVFRTIRDDFGRVYKEKPLGNWTILKSYDYEIEETFWVFGRDSKHDRCDISEIIKLLFKGGYSTLMTKQIIVINNKLLIYNEEYFDMVLCKNIDDAQRLHHTLAKIAKKQKIKNLLFMGTASNVMVSILYDLIQEKTGWKRNKIKLKTTVH